MEPTIRLISDFEPDIIAAVTALEDAHFGRGGLNEWHLPFIIRYGRLYIIEVGAGLKPAQTIVGAAQVIRSWTERSEAFLVGLSIAPASRGRGLGGRLIDGIIEDLKNQGIAKLQLTASPDNEAALRMYERLSFKVAGELPQEYGPGNDRLLMSIDLAVKHG